MSSNVYVFFSGLDDISVSQMQIYKCCTNDFDFNETVCLNLVDQFPEQNKLVQAEVGFLSSWNKQKQQQTTYIQSVLIDDWIMEIFLKLYP